MSVLTMPAPEVMRPATSLRPKVTIRPARGKECSDAGPWCISGGVTDYEVAAFSDDSNKHAPETVDMLRGLFHPVDHPSEIPAMLIYVHRGQKSESMMPLLPSLLHAINYRGPCCTIRIPDAATDAEAKQKIDRFIAGQLPDDGFAVLVVDRQHRIGPVGTLKADTVEISFPERSSAARAPHSISNRSYI
ncbi:MAG: hypothetical protein ACSHXB_16090 [Sulfitobacter sp.]